MGICGLKKLSSFPAFFPNPQISSAEFLKWDYTQKSFPEKVIFTKNMPDASLSLNENKLNQKTFP